MFSDQNVFILLFLLLGVAIICSKVSEWKAGTWGYGVGVCVVLSFLIVVLKVFAHV